MDGERTPIAELLERYHAGDPDAIAELYSSYQTVLRVMVRRQMPRELRPAFDSLDFAQDVWTSFIAMPVGEKHFPTAKALRGFLARIAYNKLMDTYRRQQLNPNADPSEAEPPPRPSLEPSPSQMAIADERWSKIAARLTPPQKAIVQWIRDGYSLQEVAAKAQCTPRTVTRILNRAYSRCEVAP